MKEKNEMTWKEIFKLYFLVRIVIPLAALAIFIFLFGNTSSKGNSLLVGLGVIIGIIALFGILNFLYISTLKLFKIKRNSEDQNAESEA